MPTYMYKCRDCGHRFEEVQGFHDDPLEVCPDCGGQVQRVIGNVGVTFKGSKARKMRPNRSCCSLTILRVSA